MLKLCADCGEIALDNDHICQLLDECNEDLSWESSSSHKVFLHHVIQNVEELINEVFIRPPLWDNTLPYEKRGPSVTKFLWTEIDTKLSKFLNFHKEKNLYYYFKT